VQRVT